MPKFVLPISVVLVILMSGCVAIPIPIAQEKPFQQKEMPNLKIGDSGRAEVLYTIGEPDLIFDDERIFIYTKTQTHMVWLVAVGAGYTGDIGVLPGSWTEHYLGVWFNNEHRVSHIEAIPYVDNKLVTEPAQDPTSSTNTTSKQADNCFRNGFCLVDKLASSPHKKHTKAHILYGPPTQFKKTTSSREELCRIVVFTDIQTEPERLKNINLRSIRFKMDGRVIGPYVDNTYYSFLVKPGRRTFLVSGHNGSIWKPESISKRQTIRCQSLEKFYLQISFVSTKTANEVIRMRQVDEQTARTALQNRRRLMHQWKSPSVSIDARRFY